MALVAPSIMSTTTCLQLEELSNKPSTFHRYICSEPHFQPCVPTTTHAKIDEHTSTPASPLEAKQRVLLLKAAREQYTLVDDHHVPSILHPGEVLVKVCALNNCFEISILDIDHFLAGFGDRPEPDRLERTVCDITLFL